MEESRLQIQDKFMLTIREAAEYFGIGIKKIRRLAEDNLDSFAVIIGNRYMIIRPKFEEYIINILETKKNEQANEGLSLNDDLSLQGYDYGQNLYSQPERHRRAKSALQ